MGSESTSAGRGLRVASLLFVLFLSGVFLGSRPAPVLAQEYEAMMPDALSREVRKAEREYRTIMNAVSVAESERFAKAAAGATEAELRELDAKVGRLVTEAEKLKVQADYLTELYNAKRQDYKGR
jgi:cell division protein FtsB